MEDSKSCITVARKRSAFATTVNILCLIQRGQAVDAFFTIQTISYWNEKTKKTKNFSVKSSHLNVEIDMA